MARIAAAAGVVILQKIQCFTGFSTHSSDAAFDTFILDLNQSVGYPSTLPNAAFTALSDNRRG